MSRPSKRIAPPSLPRLPEIWPMRVVLPAPFGPIRACTSPGFSSSVTSSVATTPPKRFETFLSSSMLLPREQARDALGSEEHDRKQRSEERRVGKECRSRWWTDQDKKKQKTVRKEY